MVNKESEYLKDEELISEAFVEKLKSQDDRWRLVETAIKIEEELRNSEALRVVLKVIEKEAAVALEKLVFADPTDAKLITSLQADVRRARIMGNTLESIRQRGAFAQQELVNEDQVDTSNGRDT